MFKIAARDPSTNWVLLAIHAEENKKYKADKEFGFWAKFGLWLKGKL